MFIDEYVFNRYLEKKYNEYVEDYDSYSKTYNNLSAKMRKHYDYPPACKTLEDFIEDYWNRQYYTYDKIYNQNERMIDVSNIPCIFVDDMLSGKPMMTVGVFRATLIKEVVRKIREEKEKLVPD